MYTLIVSESPSLIYGTFKTWLAVARLITWMAWLSWRVYRGVVVPSVWGWEAAQTGWVECRTEREYFMAALISLPCFLQHSEASGEMKNKKEGKLSNIKKWKNGKNENMKNWKTEDGKTQEHSEIQENDNFEKIAGVQHLCARKHQTSQLHHDYRRTLQPQPHTNRVGALISGAWLAREAVDGPQPNHCAHAAVSEKHFYSCAKIQNVSGKIKYIIIMKKWKNEKFEKHHKNRKLTKRQQRIEKHEKC